MLCKNSKEKNTDMSRHGENMAEGKLGNKNNYQTSVVSHFSLHTEDIFNMTDCTGDGVCLHGHNNTIIKIL